MRLFFALPLPEELKASLARFQQEIRPAVSHASWPDAGGLHLTLAFLGETEEAAVPGLLDLAQATAAGCTGFTLHTARPGGFPTDSAARVLWLGLEEEPALVRLCGALRDALRQAGVPFDARPFRPHLTVGRFRNPADTRRFGAGPAPVAFEVRELVLFRSLATPEGMRYLAMGSQHLG